MQECGDDPLLIESPFRGEIEHVDAVEHRVRGVADQRLDGGDDPRVGPEPFGSANRKVRLVIFSRG